MTTRSVLNSCNGRCHSCGCDGPDSARSGGRYQYYGVNDNWSQLMMYRQTAKQLAFRWLNRRSQKKSKNWGQFDAYQARFPLATPKKLTDLIAMGAAQR